MGDKYNGNDNSDSIIPKLANIKIDSVQINTSALKSMRSEFSKERRTFAADNKFKEKLNLIAVKLADDVSLKNKEVYLHPVS